MLGMVSYKCAIVTLSVRRFSDIRLQICRDLENRVRVRQGHWKCNHSIERISYERSIATMGLSHTTSEIDGDFSRKSQNFPTSLYFAPPQKGFPLQLSIGAGNQKTRMMGLLDREISLTISSAFWIQCTNVTDGQTDGRTDRQTPGDSKDRAYA